MEIKLTEKIKQIIRNDIPLRKKLGFQLGIEPSTVYQYVLYPKREKALTKRPITLKVLRDHTGMKESEILIMQ